MDRPTCIAPPLPRPACPREMPARSRRTPDASSYACGQATSPLLQFILPAHWFIVSQLLATAAAGLVHLVDTFASAGHDHPGLGEWSPGASLSDPAVDDHC